MVTSSNFILAGSPVVTFVGRGGLVLFHVGCITFVGRGVEVGVLSCVEKFCGVKRGRYVTMLDWAHSCDVV